MVRQYVYNSEDAATPRKLFRDVGCWAVGPTLKEEVAVAVSDALRTGVSELLDCKLEHFLDALAPPKLAFADIEGISFKGFYLRFKSREECRAEHL